MTEQHDKLVSQEAREAAGAFLRRDAMERGAHFSTADIAGRAVEQGEYDSDYLVQAFQRAMNQAAEAARADAFEEPFGYVVRHPEHNPYGAFYTRPVLTEADLRAGWTITPVYTAIRAKAVGNG